MASRRNGPPLQPQQQRSEATSAIMIPLAMAWAYLDAIAKTWLALGEKLSDSLTFYGSSSSSGSRGSGSGGSGSSNSNKSNGSAFCSTSVGVPNSNSNSSTIRRNKITKSNHRPTRDRESFAAGATRCAATDGTQPKRSTKHANRLEFSLTEYLQSLCHYTRASTCRVPTSASSATPGRDGTPSTSRGVGGEGVGATESGSWLRLPSIARASGSADPSAKLPGPHPRGLPLSARHRATDKTLVLDLDETLISARRSGEMGPDGRFDFMVVLPPRLRGKIGGLSLCSGRETSVASAPGRGGGRGDQNNLGTTWSAGIGSGGGCGRRRIYVRKRPHLREFLQQASRLFEVVLFTAAREEFANAVLDEIDPGRELVDHVLSRESCMRLKIGGGKRRGRRAVESKRGTEVIKDLGILGRPLSKVIMVENSLEAIRYHLENGVHIRSFFGDREDRELLSTLDSLRPLAPLDDVRDGIIRLYVEKQARKEGHTLPDELPPLAPSY